MVRTSGRIALALTLLVGLAIVGQAQTFDTLFRFPGGSDGDTPIASVVQSAAGNLYGTTMYGGSGDGVIYELDPEGKEVVLHAFSGKPDGAGSLTPLILDSFGNLYGTTTYGGSGPCYAGCGAVFKIDAEGNEVVLYSFTASSDGNAPEQGLALDESGTLFGTTLVGGSSGWGTVFKLDSSGALTVLHTFAGPPSDGANPEYGHVTMDKSGNLFGVAQLGGSDGCEQQGCGVLYKLTRSGRYTILHTFADAPSDGAFPYGSVILDDAGNIYGTTYGGGSNQCGFLGGCGTVWKVSKSGKETILHNFSRSDGCWPQSGVVRDSKGNLHGVTTGCGAKGSDYGALYEVSAKGEFTVLHSFKWQDPAFAYAYGELLQTKTGTLFGTSPYASYGTVWTYTP